MESRQIKDNQITASSELYDASYAKRFAAAYGRANATAFSRRGAWVALAGDNDMWFEVDFLYNTTVREIMTQGRQDYDQWVKFYSISSKNETSDFREYGLGDGVRSKVNEFHSENFFIISDSVVHVLLVKPASKARLSY